MRHASALGLSQSLALNLPLALIFQWVPGRFPTSEGRDHNHFQDGNHQGAGEQQPRCERRGRGEMIRNLPRKGILREPALPSDSSPPGSCPLPVPSSPDPSP